MYVTITLIICLSVVFVITFGIVSCTLRDKNFKARFDKSNERLKRIIKEQHDELISYREAIKKNDANLERSLEVLASASDTVKRKISRLNDAEEALSRLKVEVGNLNLSQDKFLEMIDKRFDETSLSRTSYLSIEEKKRFKEYLQACTFKFHDIDNMKYKNDYTFVKVRDVIRALDIVGYDQWDSILDTIPSEEFNNGQNTERNQ